MGAEAIMSMACTLASLTKVLSPALTLRVSGNWREGVSCHSRSTELCVVVQASSNSSNQQARGSRMRKFEAVPELHKETLFGNKRSGHTKIRSSALSSGTH